MAFEWENEEWGVAEFVINSNGVTCQLCRTPVTVVHQVPQLMAGHSEQSSLYS